MSLISFLFLLLMALTLFGAWQLKYTHKVTTLNIPTNNENLVGQKIVGFSDPQFTYFTQARLAHRLTKILRELEPDKILIAGDIFDGEKLYWPPIERELQNWSRVAPVYAVTGNHEHYGDFSEFLNLLQKANFTILSDQLLDIGGVKIVGTNFAFNKKEKVHDDNFLFQTLAKNKIDIILRHKPPMLAEAKKIAEYNPTLMFAGHTHNGQSWPNNYILRSIYGSFSYGKTKIKNTVFYTTSGFGITIIPVRLFNPPEIVVINFYQE